MKNVAHFSFFSFKNQNHDRKKDNSNADQFKRPYVTSVNEIQILVDTRHKLTLTRYAKRSLTVNLRLNDWTKPHLAIYLHIFDTTKSVNLFDKISNSRICSITIQIEFVNHNVDNDFDLFDNRSNVANCMSTQM